MGFQRGMALGPSFWDKIWSNLCTEQRGVGEGWGEEWRVTEGILEKSAKVLSVQTETGMYKSPEQASTDQGWRCNSKCYAHTCPCAAGSAPPSPDPLLPGQLHPSSSPCQCLHTLALSSPPLSHLHHFSPPTPAHQRGLSPRIAVPLSAPCFYPCP